MKNIFLLLTIAVTLFTSCEKESVNANRMQHGSGRWAISSIEYTTYDSSGNADMDTILNDVGEFIFFQSEGTDALYGYYVGIFFLNQPDGTKLGYTMQWMNDGHRFNVLAPATTPDFNKVYTVADDKGNEIELTYTTSGNSSASSLASKEVMKLKYQPGYKN
mgnify:CR=1 FL=1